MIQKRGTFFLGLFIFLIPFLGLPTSWKTTLMVLAGLTLIYSSITITLPDRFRKSTRKPEIKTGIKRRPRKVRGEAASDSIIYSANDTSESPKMPDIE
jgi:hypothetical protein